MKIAIFSESYLPFLNGVTISIRILREELIRRGHEVWVYAPRFRDYQEEDPYVRRFPSIYTPFERHYPIALPFAPRLWREWKAQHFHLIHTHTPFLLGWLALRWGEKAGVPLVSTYHTLYEQYLHYVPPVVPRRLVHYALRRYLRWYYQQMRQIITSSETAGKLLKEYGVQKPIRAIRNAVLPFPDLSKSEVRQKLGIPEEILMLLYVGRLAKEKNLWLLFHSLPPVFHRFPQAHLWVVGTGPQRQELEDFCRRVGLESHFHFTGALPREEISFYLLASDLFTFPSLTESQGMVIDEAQAAGLPCVVANGGGAPEAVEHEVTGLVVEPLPEAFTEAILTLLQNEELRLHLGRNGIRKRETLSVATMVDRVLEVYHAALAGKSSGE